MLNGARIYHQQQKKKRINPEITLLHKSSLISGLASTVTTVDSSIGKESTIGGLLSLC